MVHGTIYLILAIIFGGFMAWGVGANDVANAMGTSVGSRALTIKQAIIIAAIFEALGALLAGGQVTQTIRGSIIDSHMLMHSPQLLIYGMLAALLAAGTWLAVASIFGWPVSTTHSIVGALVGFGSVGLGVHYIYWRTVFNISLSWVGTPIIAGIIAFLLFTSVQRYIFITDNPFERAKRYIPVYIFIVAIVIMLVTMVSGIDHLGFKLSLRTDIVIAFLVSLLVTFIGMLILRRITLAPNASHRQQFEKVERIFGVLMIFTACAMAFAHGSNDVANAIGPLAAIVSIVQHKGIVSDETYVPLWIMLLGAFGIVVGLATYGHKVIQTVGTGITQLTPSRGFAAQLATASTVVLSSGFGLPISTTQTLVGAVLGVGFARGIAALNLGVIRNIFMSWIITLPAGAVLAIIYFYLIKWLV